MADGVEVKTGLRSLRRAIRAASDRYLEDELKKVNKQAADLVGKRAQGRAPVLSGAARRSTKGYGTKTGAKVRAGTTTKAKEYAARQHWSQQKGLRGEEWVYQAMGESGNEVVKFYWDNIRDMARDLNSKNHPAE